MGDGKKSSLLRAQLKQKAKPLTAPCGRPLLTPDRARYSAVSDFGLTAAIRMANSHYRRPGLVPARTCGLRVQTPTQQAACHLKMQPWHRPIVTGAAREGCASGHGKDVTAFARPAAISGCA